MKDPDKDVTFDIDISVADVEIYPIFVDID
jgi:hypothetical protein